MNKFLLRRIGLGDEQTGFRPSLKECLDVVLLQADALMDGILDGLAALSAKPQGKGSYHVDSAVEPATIEHLRAQAVALKRAFTGELQAAVYHSGSPDVIAPPIVRFEDLQLFDSAQIDASIEFALVRQEVLRCVEDVLPAFNARVSHLMGWTTVQPQLNPLKPDAFVRALLICLDQFVPDEKARTSLPMSAAGLLGVGLRQLYREVGDWLRSQGVESASTSGASVGDSFGKGNPRGRTPDNAVGRTLVTLDKLRKLLSGELDTPPSHADFSHTVPASLVALEDMKLVEPMMKRLAKRASGPAPEGARHTGSSPPNFSAQPLAREPTQSKLLGRQLGAEVIRMMLDNLMLDKSLLPEVREVIQRLESTLLALAQADPRFFIERQHPARKFLDRLTHRSLGFASESDEGFSRFLNSISEAVSGIAGSQADADSFARALHALEDGWLVEDATQRQQQGEAARALRHVEQRNLLAQRLADEFDERQKSKDIPELIASFLRGPWAQVVAESQLASDDGSADPGGYLALVDDLLWSVQLRRARRNRQRLVHLVPTMLVTLRQGLQLIHYPPERVPVFFDALIALHEKAFEGPRLPRPDVSLNVGTADLTIPQVDEFLDEVAPLEGIEYWGAEEEIIETGHMESGANRGTDEALRPWSAGDFTTGMWVELMVDNTWRRVQLTWASPHRTLFMFVARGGEAHSMSRRTMERLRMQSRIRFVSDGHAVEKALDGVAVSALQNDLGQMNQGS
jgi:hypothetical protein